MLDGESTNTDQPVESQATDTSVDELFGELMNSGEQQNDTAEGSSPETNEAETDPSQEGAESSETVEESEDNTPDASEELPLNKDVRFQEKVREAQILKEQLAQQKEMIDKLLSGQPQQKTEEIPQAFLQTFGSGDPEQDKTAWSAYKQLLDYQKEQILAEVRQQEEAKTQQQVQWDNWVDTQLANFKEQGVEIPRDDFLEILEEYEPSDGLKGYDPVKVAKIYNLRQEIAELKMSQEQNSEKQKQTARKGVVPKVSGTSSEEKEFFTLDDSTLWKSRFKR